MAIRRLRFKPSLAETRRQNQAAMDFLLACSPRPDAVRVDVGAREKQVRARPEPGDGEDGVVSSVSQLLKIHPRVAIARRMNSGAAMNADGRPIRFHILLKGRGVVVDFDGLLVDGRPFALEAKHPNWRGPSDANNDKALRERMQALYLEQVRSVGGLAGFICSVEDALKVLGPVNGSGP